MSFDSGRGNSSAGRSSSVTTSPSMSLTPGENTLFHGFDWSSNSESNSPKSSLFCEANLNDYEYPQHGQNMLPEAPPIDVFTPSLVRRPPASSARTTARTRATTLATP